MRFLKKTLCIVLVLAMQLSVFVSAGIEASGASRELIYYFGSGGEERWRFLDEITVIGPETTALEQTPYGSWYSTGGSTYGIVKETYYIKHDITVSGNVNLILQDRRTVFVEGSIFVPDGSTLTIWAHEDGELNVKATDNAAGIGGKENAKGGSIVINGGYISANGEDAAGIGGGKGENSGFQSITINGGTVIARGNNGAGIGDGNDNTKSGGSVITINGGTVEAYGDDGGAGIGGASDSKHSNSKIIINGGTVTATGGTDGAGIGGGDDSNDWRSITITGGTVTATGGTEDRGFVSGSSAAGIGGGEDRGNGVITITGGTVRAYGGGKDVQGGSAGIGGGNEGSQDNPIYISGGDVKAYGGRGAAGIGGGNAGNGNTLYISGGTVEAVAGMYSNGIGAGSHQSWSLEYPDENAYKSGDTYISGGYVKATSFPNPDSDTESGAGICSYDGDTVTITGGVVIAEAYRYGAGIGSGTYDEKNGGTINILGGCVYASSMNGAGIGKRGNNARDKTGNSTVINIENSVVVAVSTARGAGIGGGAYTDGGTVNISNSNVTAVGGNIDYNWFMDNGPFMATAYGAGYVSPTGEGSFYFYSDSRL